MHQLAEYARTWWEHEGLGTPVPGSDREVVDVYFSAVADISEYVDIFKDIEIGDDCKYLKSVPIKE